MFFTFINSCICKYSSLLYKNKVIINFNNVIVQNYKLQANDYYKRKTK